MRRDGPPDKPQHGVLVENVAQRDTTPEVRGQSIQASEPQPAATGLAWAMHHHVMVAAGCLRVGRDLGDLDTPRRRLRDSDEKINLDVAYSKRGSSRRKAPMQLVRRRPPVKQETPVGSASRRDRRTSERRAGGLVPAVADTRERLQQD